MIDINARVQRVLQTGVVSSRHLSGGCIGDVRQLALEDGRNVVAKIGNGSSPGLALEGFMLNYLAKNSSLPVPDVLHADDTLLIMSKLPTSGAIDHEAEEDAAHHIAGLHDITSDHFGFERDTLIGGLVQPNPQQKSWIEFFRVHRLMYMGRRCTKSGRIPSNILSRLERFCAHLDKWLAEPSAASLLHGDLWTGNVLVHRGKISGFVDPAIYYGDPEIELAFTTLFGTFGKSYFRRYDELRGLKPGFFEERQDIYNLYPLLVHVNLFGGSYVNSVDRTLRRFGY